jgi:hypothetical protein
MKYYEIRQADMTVLGEIETDAGDVISVRVGHFVLGEPAVAMILAAGGYQSDREAFEANGYVWAVPE